MVPLAVGLLLAPTAAVFQARALAALATIVLGLTLVAHWRAHGRLAWPRGAGRAAALATLALLGWGALSAIWSVDPGRTLFEAARIGALLLLGTLAAAALAEAGAAGRRAVGQALLAGCAAGLLLASVDVLTGHGLRAASRGLAEATPRLMFGAKPIGSVLALLLPLAVVLPRAGWARVAVAVAGLAVVVALPGESARLAALAGLAACGLGLLAPRLVPVALGSILAGLTLIGPLLLSAALSRELPADRLPLSAAHRLVIWEFALGRIAERPLLGWGMEASRALPGAQEPADPATLARFHLTSPAAQAFFGRAEGAQRLPLHPHNAVLQLWLELGGVGAAAGAGLLLALGLAIRAGPAPAAGAGVLAAGAVSGLLSYGLWQAWWLGALVLALAAAVALRPPIAPARC